MKIYRATDKIKIKIDDVTVIVSPLSYERKTEVQTYMLEALKGDMKAGMEGAKLAIKYAVKGVEGAEYSDGTPFELQEENGVLTDESVDELINCEMAEKLSVVCCSLLTKVSDTFVDPRTGNPLQGVSLVKNSKRTQRK